MDLSADLLITGAAGFIGTALTRALRDAGHTVTAVDNLSVDSARPRPDLLQVRDVRSLTPADLDGIDTVIHLAAHKSVPRSFDVGGFEHNVTVDRHMMHTFAASRARRLLLASSCEVYGQQSGPLGETSPHAPRSPYAAGKAATEHLAGIYRPLLQAERQIGVVRLFNIFGPEEDPDAVVPAFLDAAAENRPLTVEGDGSQARDLTHIDDAVTMIFRILDRPRLLPVVNCGSGHPVSIRALADAVLRATGGGSITHTARRPNEVRSFTADMSLFTTVYGQVSLRSLDRALAATVRDRSRAWKKPAEARPSAPHPRPRPPPRRPRNSGPTAFTGGRVRHPRPPSGRPALRPRPRTPRRSTNPAAGSLMPSGCSTPRPHLRSFSPPAACGPHREPRPDPAICSAGAP